MQTIRFAANGGVALLTIDVPERPLNILTPELEEDLAACIERVASSEDIRGAVITSGRSNSFLAGADLKDLVGICGKETLQQAFGRSQRLSQLLRRMETCGKPFAAAINGTALGGGLELCLACHYRVVADRTDILIGLPEVKVGLLPGAGGTQRLPRLIGIPAALPLLLEGKSMTPLEAARLGIMHVVAAPERLIEVASEWVLANSGAQQPWDVKGYRIPGGAGCLAAHANESFMAGTARQAAATQRNYPAPLAILSSVFEGTQVPIDVGLRIESKYIAKLLTHPVARNLMRTMFINKGRAERLVARPVDAPRSDFTRIGVLGAGMMGAGIAHVAAAAGIDVVLLDSSLELAEKGRDHVRKSQAHADALLARIKPTADYADLAGCDVLVEAVFEDRRIKQDVTRKAQAVLGDVIFASNTSTLPITGLAQTSLHPQNFIGMHFFSPVERMPLVEIILGKQTGTRALATALDLVGKLRKTPIVVRDSPGFYTSRVFMAFIDEGMAMLAEGISPVLIENAARMAGMPVGPLAVTDEVTIDLQLKVLQQAEADGLPAEFQRRHAQPVIHRMMELERAGRRYGRGFYEYPADAKKHLWSGLTAIFPSKTVQPDVELIKQRLLYIQALEAARCLESGIITDPADADLGSVLGVGFPSWTGGTLSFIETVGLGAFVAGCKRLAQRHGPRFAPSEWLAAQTETVVSENSVVRPLPDNRS